MDAMDPAVDDDTGRHTARWVALVVGVVLAVFVVVLATRPSAEERSLEFTLAGRGVPEVAGPTLDGGTFDIDDERGRWVLVNFFATWCVPCRQEHPELVAFAEDHAEDATVVSVAFDDGEQALRDFFAAEGGDWPVIVGDTGPLSLAFGVTGVPESYLVAPNGIVVAKFTGVTQAEVERVMAETMGGDPPTSATTGSNATSGAGGS